MQSKHFCLFPWTLREVKIFTAWSWCSFSISFQLEDLSSSLISWSQLINSSLWILFNTSHYRREWSSPRIIYVQHRPICLRTTKHPLTCTKFGVQRCFYMMTSHTTCLSQNTTQPQCVLSPSDQRLHISSPLTSTYWYYMMTKPACIMSGMSMWCICFSCTWLFFAFLCFQSALLYSVTLVCIPAHHIKFHWCCCGVFDEDLWKIQ